MAVLRRQEAHTQALFGGGALEAGERDAVLGELGRRMRRLEITGEGRQQSSALGATPA